MPSNELFVALGLAPRVLKAVDPPVLRAFFEDIFEIIDRDQFGEVNLLMPKLALAQDAIPVELFPRYVDVLLSQARSASYDGAPAAGRALQSLPTAIVDVAMNLVNIDKCHQCIVQNVNMFVRREDG